MISRLEALDDYRPRQPRNDARAGHSATLYCPPGTLQVVLMTRKAWCT